MSIILMIKMKKNMKKKGRLIKMFKNKPTADTKVSVVKSLTPHVYITTEAIVNMQLYVQGCADEIGWLGTAYKIGKDIHIEKVYLFEQQVHATTTEITPDGLAAFGEAILTNPDVDGMEVWNNLKMWGHSHVNMACNPSGQDDAQMVTFAQSGHDWFIRLIANKRGEMRVDLYDYNSGLAYCDLPWTEKVSEDETAIMNYIAELYQQVETNKLQYVSAVKPIVDAEIKRKVSKIVFQTQYNQNRHVVTQQQQQHNTYRQQQIAIQQGTATVSDMIKADGVDEKKNSTGNSFDNSGRTSERIVGDSVLEAWISDNFTDADLNELQEIACPEDLEEELFAVYRTTVDSQTIENFFRFLSNRLIKQMDWHEDNAYGGMYQWEN